METFAAIAWISLSGLIVAIIGVAASVGLTAGTLAQKREDRQRRRQAELDAEQSRVEQMIEAFTDQAATPFEPARPGVLSRLGDVEDDVEDLKRWRHGEEAS